ncbi:hypothetical protein G6F22_020054 [Rhizopus arrhizus]|nr:hypothetical protein G6F22_020054 [Rhizopus arrhizus]
MRRRPQVLEHLGTRRDRQCLAQAALGQALVQREILATRIEEIGHTGGFAVVRRAGQPLDQRDGRAQLQVTLQRSRRPRGGGQAQCHLRLAGVVGHHHQALVALQVGRAQRLRAVLAKLDVPAPRVLGHVGQPCSPAPR